MGHSHLEVTGGKLIFKPFFQWQLRSQWLFVKPNEMQLPFSESKFSQTTITLRFLLSWESFRGCQQCNQTAKKRKDFSFLEKKSLVNSFLKEEIDGDDDAFWMKTRKMISHWKKKVVQYTYSLDVVSLSSLRKPDKKIIERVWLMTWD